MYIGRCAIAMAAESGRKAVDSGRAEAESERTEVERCSMSLSDVLDISNIGQRLTQWL
jgi:hypothetical protein